ncbi:polysaccharide deacetylase family protein [Rhizobium sp. FY34]|uniref:polysaccharide deacetylase family protein n=1 Tax=Rhizobium sp. FY34 TaxID=2562309 RepID=UPI001FEF7AEC|nr:polysaccharide deacetylase family protein [Rhizobium sp. FY34]
MTMYPTNKPASRDFLGYAGHPANPKWPSGARLAVSFVLNFEEGAEYSIRDGDDRNEAVYEVTDRRDGPDPCIDSHFEYGTRAAWWRIMDLFDRYDFPITVSACGKAVERLPTLARDAVKRGHELSAHGWRWESHAGMDEATEREVIAKTVEAIRTATGQRPVGWHTRSASSPNTRRLLVEEGGFLYDSDAYNDDIPYDLTVDGKRHIVLPYAFDTNDMHYFHTQRFSGNDFADYVNNAADWLHGEGGKMLSVGLHLRMIGRPGRMGALAKILDHIAAKDNVWVARRADIARHWRDVHSEPVL